VADREYIMAYTLQKESDGTIYLLGKSIENPKMPTKSSPVRAFLHVRDRKRIDGFFTSWEDGD